MMGEMEKVAATGYEAEEGAEDPLLCEGCAVWLEELGC